MAEYQDSLDDDPVIEQRRNVPPGSVPMGRRSWVWIGLGLVCVVFILYSGKQTERRPAAMTQPLPNPTSIRDIEQLDKKLSEDIARMKLDSDMAKRQNIDYTKLNAAEVRGEDPMRSGYQQVTREVPEQVDPIEAAQRKKDYDSLFAPNVSLSRRPKDAAVDRPEIAQARPSTTPVQSSVGERQDEPQAKPDDRKRPQPVPAGWSRLFEHTVLEAVLVNQLEGEFSGPVNCQITTAVYSRDGQTLLIPQGSRVFGEAKQVSGGDQRRLAVVFHRLLMPDGYSVDLDKMPGLDQMGETALKDKVNHHYLSTFGTSIMLGLLAGLSIQGTQGVYQGDASDIYRQGVSDQLSRDAMRILQRQLNRLPDITIRPGHRVKLLLNADLALPPYDKHPKIDGV